MESRYLYRGKRIDNREWVEGFLFMVNDVPYILPHHKTGQPIHADNLLKTVVEVLEDTICQCTGLKDKNGKLIWENDIIERLDIHDIKEPSIGIIEYDVENTSFLIHWTDIAKYSPTFPWKNRIGVIGNIFDNPELLESEE